MESVIKGDAKEEKMKIKVRKRWHGGILLAGLLLVVLLAGTGLADAQPARRTAASAAEDQMRVLDPFSLRVFGTAARTVRSSLRVPQLTDRGFISLAVYVPARPQARSPFMPPLVPVRANAAPWVQ